MTNEKLNFSQKKEKNQEELNEHKKEEIGGYEGPEPTIHGDWQHKGRVSDF